jgi:hypothetical protein
LRWIVTPEGVDDPIGRDDLVRMEQQQCEESAKPRPVQWDGDAVLHHLQRPQDAELDHRLSPSLDLLAVTIGRPG